ncbi:hypothetical protein M758_4G178700 [Ceratodon purpureus]|nr:hypothetical protein M758_4G178700 [Ceratodon purpureus]
MGNCFRRCLGDDSDSDHQKVTYSGHNPDSYVSYASGGDRARPPSNFSYNVVGFTAVARDLLDFEATHKVPVALKDYVAASKSTQIIWYEKLLAAWKKAKPAPATAEEVAILLIQTLQAHNFRNFEGLLDFYHLPWPKFSKPTGKPAPEVIVPEADGAWPEDVEYEIHTLPVHEGAAGDGDGLTVYVDVYKDAREKGSLPVEIRDAVIKRRDARAKRDYRTADALQKLIEKANYKVFDGKSGGIQCLARKYRIRLKGVDAPEIEQPYGEESKDKLNDLVNGHRLVIHVYDRDQYGRAVGDVHGNGIFIQWERDARAARRGLWAEDFPEKPWDYRRKHNTRYKGRSARKRGA